MRQRHHRLFQGVFTALLLVATSIPVSASDCSPVSSAATTLHTLTVSSIKLASTTVSNTLLSGAAGMWNGTCATSTTHDIPLITTSGSASATIDVVLHPGSTDTSICGAGAAGCGCSSIIWPDGSGGVSNGTIHLFETAANGVGCASTRSETIAHEIGHNLGLDDVEADCFAMCAGHIMGRPFAMPTLSVDATDCANTDAIWDVPNEDDGGGPGGSCQIVKEVEQ